MSKRAWHEEESGYFDCIKTLAEIIGGIDLFLVARSPAKRTHRIITRIGKYLNNNPKLNVKTFGSSMFI